MSNVKYLIGELVKSLQEGQPSSVVIAASTEHARYLQHRLCQALDAEGEPYLLLKARSRVLVGEQMVEFVSIQRIDEWRCGHRGFGEFWHDYASWCYDRYLDKTQVECTGN